MSDDQGNAGTGPDESGSTLTAPEIIKDDGTLAEGWQGILPEELREDASLKTINSFHDLAKGFVHAKAQVGKDRVALPGEKATDEEWAEFDSLIGRPKTADEYRFDVPDELKDHFKPEVLVAMRTVFHKAGLSQRNTEPLWAFLQKLAVDERAEQEASQEADRNDAENFLRKRWGMAYEERKHIVNRMIAENTDGPDEQEALLALLGNHAVAAAFIAKLGNHFIEAKIVTDIASDKKSPKEAIAQAEELRATEGYLSGKLKDADPAKHRRITEETTELYKQAHPEPVEARQGR